MRPIPLQNQFGAGMKRDFARNRMPPNSAWTLKDYIADNVYPLRERAGWANASESPGGSGNVLGGIYATFSPTAGAIAKNIYIGNDGTLYLFTAAATTSVGATFTTLLQNPVYHGGVAASAATPVFTGLVIVVDGSGAAVPKVYDGTSLTAMHGTPPKARLATVYKDYTVLGNGTVGSTLYPNRIWFSPPGDPDCAGTSGITAWDTTDSWIDFSLPVRGLASTKNVIFVWGDGQVSRVRGSVPPPDQDMTVDDPWLQVGLLDPMSIVVNEDIVYWAAPEGVFRSDGVYLDNIAAKGGMLRHWLDLVSTATSSWTVAAGVIRNNLIISVMDGTTFKDAFAIDLKTYTWTQLTNFKARCLWNGASGLADETYFGRRDVLRVGSLNSMFASVGASAYSADGDGTAVAAVIETPFYDLGRPGIKNIKGIYVGYNLIDFGVANPTVDVAYSGSPEAIAYTSLGSLVETSTYSRNRLQLGGRFYGIALKLTRSGAGDMSLADLSAEVSFQEESKRK